MRARPGEVLGAVVSPTEQACGQLVACGRGAIVLLEIARADGAILRGRALSDLDWTGRVLGGRLRRRQASAAGRTMHRDFAQYFADPVTKEPLHLTIVRERHGRVIEGAFVSSIARYPIVNGIPRFVDPHASPYASSFGYQWTRWPRLQFESENAGKVMEGYTRRMWESITGMTEPRRRSDWCSTSAAGRDDSSTSPGAKGARVIGIDYSGAVEPAARSFAHDPGVCICQGDALHLPIRSGSMDGAFTIGALHHTPDPACGVREAAAALAPGGWFAISVYTAGGFYDARMVQAWRRLFVRLWPYARAHAAAGLRAPRGPCGARASLSAAGGPRCCTRSVRRSICPTSTGRCSTRSTASRRAISPRIRATKSSRG